MIQSKFGSLTAWPVSPKLRVYLNSKDLVFVINVHRSNLIFPQKKISFLSTSSTNVWSSFQFAYIWKVENESKPFHIISALTLYLHKLHTLFVRLLLSIRELKVNAFSSRSSCHWSIKIKILKLNLLKGIVCSHVESDFIDERPRFDVDTYNSFIVSKLKSIEEFIKPSKAVRYISFCEKF